MDLSQELIKIAYELEQTDLMYRNSAVVSAPMDGEDDDDYLRATDGCALESEYDECVHGCTLKIVPIDFKESEPIHFKESDPYGESYDYW